MAEFRESLKGDANTVTLSEGAYRVTLYGSGFVWQQMTVRIEAGRKKTLTPSLASGVQRQLVFPAPEPDWWPSIESFRVSIQSVGGSTTLESEFTREDLWPFTWWPALAVGNYEIRVDVPGRRPLVGHFRIPSLRPSKRPILIPLLER